MTIRHMNIFLAICENGCNTTKAAQALHMTQPAVSLALREVEQYYGAVLFERVGRRLQITGAGRRFLEYARHICAQFDDMEKTMRGWDSQGLLRVGASITIGSQFLPEYVRAFGSRFPDVSVRCTVAPSEVLEEKIMKNELDFALIEGVAHMPCMEAEAYMEDRLTAVFQANGKYAHGQTISLEEMKKIPLLLREKGSGTREIFDRAAEDAGMRAEPSWEAASTTALINAAISGLGVAVIPQRMAQEPLRQGRVIALRVEGLELRRKFYIIRHRQKHLTQVAKAFMEICRTFEAAQPQ